MTTEADHVADELQKFMDAFFPPISKHHNKAEGADLAKAAAKFARAAASILSFIEASKISDVRKMELNNYLFSMCLACQQHKNVRLGAVERLEEELKKPPPRRQKFTPKIVKDDDPPGAA